MPKQLVFAVNKALESGALQVNVTTSVNSKQIRSVQFNGREHIVIPSYTLPANVVMNDVMYPGSEIDQFYKELEGTVAPIGHPTVNGLHVAAASPEGLNVGYVGAWNRNVEKSGDRIYLEKWVDVAVAEQSKNGKRLLEICRKAIAGEKVQVHTSVALFIEKSKVDNPSYGHIAKIIAMDHDAILLDEPGAAGPEQGVGLMVNADDAKALHVHEGALGNELGYRQTLDMLDIAARAKFAAAKDDWVHCPECTPTRVVVVLNGEAFVYPYAIESNLAIIGDSGTKVIQKTVWETVKSLFGFPTMQAKPPATNQAKGVEMPITDEERQAIVKDTAVAVLAGMQEPLAAITANMKLLTDAHAATQQSAETSMREAVKTAHGDVVANALKGADLKAAFDALPTASAAPAAPTGSAAPVPPAGAPAVNSQKKGAPDLTSYFGAN